MVDIVRYYLDSAGISNYMDEDVEAIYASGHPAATCSVLASLAAPSIIEKETLDIMQRCVKRSKRSSTNRGN